MKRVHIKGVGIVEIPDDVNPNDPDVQHDIYAQLQEGTLEPMQQFAADPRKEARAIEAGDISSMLGVPVAPGELNEPLARVRAGLFTADTAQEKAAEIGRQLNLGEDDFRIYKDIDGEEKVLIRPPGSKEFVQMDSPSFITFSDVAEVVGDPAAILSGLTAVATGPVGGGAAGFRGLLARLLGAGTGAFAETQIESEVRRALQTEDTPRGEVLGQSLEQFSYGALGETPGELIRTLRHASGRRVLATELEAINKELTTFFADEGFQLQYADASPLFSSIAQQAARLDPGSRAAVFGRLEQFGRTIQGEAGRLAEGGELTQEAVEGIYNKWRRGLMTGVTGPITGSRMAAAGSVQDALMAYTKMADRRGADLLKDVQTGVSLYGVTFDRTRVRRKALILARGVRDKAALAEDADELVTFPVEAPSPELAGMLERFAATEPAVESFTDKTGRKMNAYDIMVGHRRIFSRFADTALETGNRVDYDAAQSMVRSVDKMLESPTDGGPRLKSSISAHLAHEQEVERVLDTMRARSLLEEFKDQPEVLVGTLINPGKPHTTRTMHQVFQASGKNWGDVKQAYVHQLFKDPRGIERQMDLWDDVNTKRLLVSESEEARLLNFGRDWKRMESNPVIRLMMEGQASGKEAVEAILTGSQEDLIDIMRQAGGRESDMGKLIRGGIFQEIFDRASVEEAGMTVVKPGLVEAHVKTLLGSAGLEGRRTRETIGKLRTVLTDDDIAKLDLLSKVASFFPGDIGSAGFQTGALAAGVLSSSAHKALSKAFVYGMYGRLMLYPDAGAVRKWLRNAVPKFTLKEGGKIGPASAIDLTFWGPYFSLLANDAEEMVEKQSAPTDPFSQLIFEDASQSSGMNSPQMP
jgi:hypothetical protein